MKNEKFILEMKEEFIIISKDYYYFKAFCINYKNFYNNN